MESKLPSYQPLSHSRRSKFKECPRAFSFSYLEKIPQVDNIYAGVGTFVHSVIEDFYSNPKNPNPRNYKGKESLGHFTTEFNKRFEKDGAKLKDLFAISEVNNNFSTLEEWLETLIKNYITIEKFIHDNKNIEDEKFEFLEYLQFWPSASEQDLSKSNLTMEKKFDITLDDATNGEITVTGFIDQLIDSSENTSSNNDIRDQTSFFEGGKKDIATKKVPESKYVTIIDIKTSKPPKNIKLYEDQLNTYAMFLEKDSFSQKKHITKENIVAGLFFLGGEGQKAENRIFLLQDIETIGIEEKFIKSKLSIEQIHNQDLNNYANSNISDIWETKPNKLCNWCWYKNLCPFWIEKKNTNISIDKLVTKLSELRHAGGAIKNSERDSSAVLLQEINSKDITIENNIRELVKKIKKVKNQFDNFKKEIDIFDPLHELKTEIKNFLFLLRQEDLSEMFSNFIKKESVNFSSEKKDVSINTSWDRITMFFTELKKEIFLQELEKVGYMQNYQILIERGRSEWSQKQSSYISTTELLECIEEVERFLNTFDQIKDNAINYKVKLYDESFIDLLSSISEENYPLNQWLSDLNSGVKNLFNKTQLLERNNISNSLQETTQSIEAIIELLENQAFSVESFLDRI
jgi:hypothetical protein